MLNKYTIGIGIVAAIIAGVFFLGSSWNSGKVAKKTVKQFKKAVAESDKQHKWDGKVINKVIQGEAQLNEIKEKLREKLHHTKTTSTADDGEFQRLWVAAVKAANSG